MESHVGKNLPSLSNSCNSKIVNSNGDENMLISKSNNTSTMLSSSYNQSNYHDIKSGIPFYVKNLITDGKVREIKEIVNYKPNNNTDQYIHGINFTLKNENIINAFTKNFYFSKRKDNSTRLKKEKQRELRCKIGILVLRKDNDGILIREYFLFTLDYDISFKGLDKHINIKYNYISPTTTPNVYICEDSTFHASKMKKINRSKIFKLSERTEYVCFDYVDEIPNAVTCVEKFYKSQKVKK
uniref:GRAM domain-containing protein n=1 Tax=Strongyloides venezuelensis TaxID=75913 RepID=A0A0K0F6C4_STRVS